MYPSFSVLAATVLSTASAILVCDIGITSRIASRLSYSRLMCSGSKKTLPP